MPNFYAHLLFGREVSRRMPPELQRTLLRQWDAFCCGNFGPDPLYFYVGGRHAGAVRQAGIRLHHGSGRAALEAYRQPVKEGKPCAAAFAAGYLLHFALDSQMHPYVLRTIADGTVTHFALEGEFDRRLLRQDGRAYLDAMPQRPGAAGAAAGGILYGAGGDAGCISDRPEALSHGVVPHWKLGRLTGTPCGECGKRSAAGAGHSRFSAGAGASGGYAPVSAGYGGALCGSSAPWGGDAGRLLYSSGNGEAPSWKR